MAGVCLVAETCSCPRRRAKGGPWGIGAAAYLPILATRAVLHLWLPSTGPKWSTHTHPTHLGTSGTVPLRGTQQSLEHVASFPLLYLAGGWVWLKSVLILKSRICCHQSHGGDLLWFPTSPFLTFQVSLPGWIFLSTQGNNWPFFLFLINRQNLREDKWKITEMHFGAPPGTQHTPLT